MAKMQPLKFDKVNDFWLLCPECDFEYTHINGVKVYAGPLYAEIGPNHVESLEVEPDGRGSTVKVQMQCEHGHRFAVCLQFNKGNTSIYTEDRNDEIHLDPDLWRN